MKGDNDVFPFGGILNRCGDGGLEVRVPGATNNDGDGPLLRNFADWNIGPISDCGLLYCVSRVTAEYNGKNGRDIEF